MLLYTCSYHGMKYINSDPCRSKFMIKKDISTVPVLKNPVWPEWPELVYAGTRRRVVSSENWCYRSLLRTRWYDKRRPTAYRWTKPLKTIAFRKISFFGHNVRAGGLTFCLITGHYSSKRASMLEEGNAPHGCKTLQKSLAPWDWNWKCWRLIR